MNIVFFGSSQFALPSLKALLASRHRILCVVTQPDRKKGRHLYLEATAVKDISLKNNLKVYQPQDVNSLEAREYLKGLSADLFVVIAYGQILSSQILNIPKFFCINVHGSLLPKYRGAAPVNWALINGETTTGISIIKMSERMDAGAILLQKEIKIECQDNSVTLLEKLSEVGAVALPEAISLIENKNYKLFPQDEKKATFAPKLKKEDGLIKWKDGAEEIINLIRSCCGWPSAFTYYKGKLLKIYQAKVSQPSPSAAEGPYGRVIEVSKDGILVATGKGALLIEELQLQGKRMMRSAEFIAGHRIYVGESLG